MRPSLPTALALLLLPACASETATSFVSGASTDSASGESSSGDTTSTGEPTPTTGTDTSIGLSDPHTTGSDTSTSTSGTSTTSGEASTSTSTGTTSSDGETTSSSTGGDESSSSSSSSSSTGAPPPSCDDGEHNQDESDVDCGGVCAGCGAGGVCLQDSDCAAGWCDAGLCADPGCLDDSDCDAFDGDCVEATCNLESKLCDQAPIAEGEACDDDNACTIGETCDKGGCLGGKILDCSDLDSACGLAVCDPDSGVCVGEAFPNTEGDPCDDGFVCTPDDTCVAGLCGVGGPGYLFFEDFSDPAAGWELGELWQIGPAIASPEGSNGADPDADHSPAGADAIAGTLIGELVPAGAHAAACLVSPKIDASGQDTLVLSFWRHLHTDYFPFVTHTIDVFDGAVWQELEKGYPNPGVDDGAWTFLEYDLGPYANDALRVRICHAQTAAALAHAGWSLDDLTIGPYACTP